MGRTTTTKRKAPVEINKKAKKKKKSDPKDRPHVTADLEYNDINIPASKTAKWTSVNPSTKEYFQDIMTQNMSYVLQNINAPDITHVEEVMNKLKIKLNKMLNTVKAPPPMKGLAELGKIHSYKNKLENMLQEDTQTLKEIHEMIADVEAELDSDDREELENEVAELERKWEETVGTFPTMHQSMCKHLNAELEDEDQSSDNDVDIYFEELAKLTVQVTEELKDVPKI